VFFFFFNVLGVKLRPSFLPSALLLESYPRTFCCLVFEPGSHFIVQAGLEELSLKTGALLLEPHFQLQTVIIPISASQVARIVGIAFCFLVCFSDRAFFFMRYWALTLAYTLNHSTSPE
jgi:hypothetical protein